MDELRLCVVSLRYSSWSIRALLPLLHAGAKVEIETVELDMARQGDPPPPMDPEALMQLRAEELRQRRALGSVTGLFPVLWVGKVPIHEALAINEWTAEHYPAAGLWPDDPLTRAQARSLAAEMAGGFSALRSTMSCHVFARVPGFVPGGPARVEIARVRELMRDALARSFGPFLFGRFGIVDAMYFPVLTRFATYGVALPHDLQAYAEALEAQPALVEYRRLARLSPAVSVYDQYVRDLGGQLLFD